MEATIVLVLSRKRSQTIVLPTLGITIDLLEIRGNRVRIGIDAPADVPVYRQEVAPRATATVNRATKENSGQVEVQGVFAG
jgi:carbon storage regulator